MQIPFPTFQGAIINVSIFKKINSNIASSPPSVQPFAFLLPTCFRKYSVLHHRVFCWRRILIELLWRKMFWEQFFLFFFIIIIFIWTNGWMNKLMIHGKIAVGNFSATIEEYFGPCCKLCTVNWWKGMKIPSFCRPSFPLSPFFFNFFLHVLLLIWKIRNSLGKILHLTRDKRIRLDTSIHT